LTSTAIDRSDFGQSVNRALDDGRHWVGDRGNDLRNWIARDRGQEPRPQIYVNPLPDPQRPVPLTRPRTDDLPNSIPGTDTGSFCKIPTHTGNPQRPDLFKPYFDADHFITTPNGVTLPPNQDFNLVPTYPDGAMPDNPAEKFLQIHGTEPHNNIDPHTHYPRIDVSPTGIGSTKRPYRPTTAEDIDRVNGALQSGKMRLRRGRKDQGGTP
jgi:hypothetical protein